MANMLNHYDSDIRFVVFLLGLQHVFLLRGKDLHLDIKKSVVLDKKTDLIWKVHETNNIAKCGFNNDPVVFDKYEGRAELFRQNYALLLKNMQHSDSGDYTAFMVSYKDQKVAEYKVIVQDPVSPVNLIVDSVSGSSDSCNLIVTCSTVDSQISSIFTCDAQNCSLVEKGSFKAQTYSSNLTVNLQQDLIICNHSNQVSWEQTKKDIKRYCKEKTGKNSKTSHSFLLCNGQNIYTTLGGLYMSSLTGGEQQKMSGNATINEHRKAGDRASSYTATVR
uniref:Immunoglobulin V-set domain-containing protein n=1 Tax=Haplochromis burtoni TaxID=8153 RepID=A0A3Q3BUG5_HAPBU